MTYSVESLLFKAAVGVVNTAARAANSLLEVMYPPRYDVAHIWEEPEQPPQLPEPAELVAWSISGLLQWMQTERRTDVRVQCGHCLTFVGDFKAFASHMLTCDLGKEHDAEATDPHEAAAPADPHPAGAADPTPDDAAPPAPGVGSLTWFGWCYPAIVEVLAEHSFRPVPSGVRGVDSRCRCGYVGDQYDWVDHVAVFIAERVACDPARAIAALQNLQTQA